MGKVDFSRYERQISIENIGEDGQERISSSKVLVVGLGGLGSTVAMFLIRMGLGTICVIDDDDVDITNLQRQILYSEENIGKSKILCGVEKLKLINNSANIAGIEGKVTDKNVEELVSKYDVVVDCTDNFETRGIINRACIKYKKSCVFGSVNNFEGCMTVLLNGKSPCYECLMGDIDKLKNMDNNREKVGVLGAVVGVIASMQAVETIKIILGKGTIATGKLIVFNSLDMTIQTINYFKRKDCFCSNG